MLVLLLALMMVMVLALLAGQYPLSLAQVIESLGNGGAAGTAADTVVWQLRLPRLIAAVVVGAALAAAGATYQTLFRNPLVSPDLLGVSAGAGLGAVVAIFFALPLVGMQLLAWLGGVGAVAMVYGVSLANKRRDPVLVLVLAGVAVSTFLGAIISLLKVLADPYSQLPSMTFWLLGGLNSVSWQELRWAVPLIAVGLLPLFLLRSRINVFSLGDAKAQSLGVNSNRLRAGLILCATLITAAAVSFTGIIAWVGLVIPHMARLVVGSEFSRLLPTSLVMGALFLLLTDTLARTLTQMELPLGVLTALIGAPFFLYLLLRGRATRG